MRTTFFLFAMLISVVASAQRTTSVTITNTKVDYSTKTVTFDLSWKGSDANHRDEVWVFVDIQPVTGANTLGSWSPATLVPSATTVTAGSGNQYSSLTHTVVSGNTRGIWVKGTATNTTRTFAATVKVTLANGTPAKFNACAYATDYPPNANITSGSYSNGTYTLKGTTPFVINGTTTVNSSTYSAARINSITDATQCPGYRCSLKDEAVGAVGCCTGLTAIGGGTYGSSGNTYTTAAVCRDLAADNVIATTCGFAFRNTVYGPGSWYTAQSNCASMGLRLPTKLELTCILNNGYWIGNSGNASNWKCDRYHDEECQRSGCSCTHCAISFPDKSAGYWPSPCTETAPYWYCVL